MLPDEVKAELLDRETDNGVSDMSWADYDEFVDVTQAVDWGCNFDADGCAGCKTPGSAWGNAKKGCCSDCRNNIGYLSRTKEGSTDAYIELWDIRHGFWRPDGCALPPNMRSLTCLSYRCQGLRWADSNEDREAWTAFNDYSEYYDMLSCDWCEDNEDCEDQGNLDCPKFKTRDDYKDRAVSKMQARGLIQLTPA
jgi:hypothetical protein